MASKEFMQLVEQAVQGKEGAFDELCRIKAKEILYMSIRLMGNYQDGEDVAQEILLYMQAHITELKHAEAFHVWMYRIIKGKCSNMKRKNNKRILPLEEFQEEVTEERTEFLPYEVAFDDAKREHLIEIINELPFLCKMCVYMFYFDNLSYERIAEVMEISKKDVDNTLTKLKLLIRRKLQEKQESGDFLKTARAVAPVPVLLKVLTEDMDHLVMEQSVEKVLTACNIALTGAVGAAAAGTEAAGRASALKDAAIAGNTTSTGSAGRTAGALKLGLAIAAMASTGIGIYAYTRPAETEPEPPAAEAEEETESQITTDGTATESYPVEAEIRTLEDMIGEEPASVLRRYAEAEEVNLSHVRSFLEEQEIILEENLWKEEAGQETTLYVRDKKDKRLMVITRYDKAAARCELAFRFTTIEESIPEDVDIIISYDLWAE